jgi:transcriptional regulator with XRE-family HTH domain
VAKKTISINLPQTDMMRRRIHNKHFGHVFRHLTQISQERMSWLLGMSRSHYSMVESGERTLRGTERAELLALSALLTDDVLSVQDATEPELKPYQVMELERKKRQAEMALFKEKTDRTELLHELKQVRLSIHALRYLNSLTQVKEHETRNTVLMVQQRIQEKKYERLQEELLSLDQSLAKARVTLGYCEERLKKGENTPHKKG